MASIGTPLDQPRQASTAGWDELLETYSRRVREIGLGGGEKRIRRSTSAGR
jgi:hypothetical protein